MVHVLEGVLPLPDSVAATLAAPPFPLSLAGNFTTLTALVKAAPPAVQQLLEKGGPLTFLAPTGRQAGRPRGAGSRAQTGGAHTHNLMDAWHSSCCLESDAAFDAAFESGRLPPLDQLLADSEAIGSLLTYHTLNSSKQL